MKLCIIFSFSFLLMSFSSASRVLFLFPTPSKSHMIIVNALSTTLAQRGHDVTVVSAFPLSKKIDNHRDIFIRMNDETSNLMKFLVQNPNTNMFKTFPQLIKILEDLTEEMTRTPKFQQILQEEFDVVIVGMFFNNYLFGYGDHFKCPTIMYSVSGGFTPVNALVGNPLAPNAVPHLYMTRKSMNFLDRVQNFCLYSADVLMMTFFNYQQKRFYK